MIQLYRYKWKNSERRRELFGRACKVLFRLKMNSAVIEFIDNGQVEVVSRNALKKSIRL